MAHSARVRNAVFLLATAAWSMPSGAAVTTVRDTMSVLTYGEALSLSNVSGFAFSRGRSTVRQSPAPNVVDQVAGCSRLVTPFCNQVGGPVTHAPELSTSGVAISAEARAGDDATSTDVHVSSNGSALSLPGFGTRQLTVEATDWQLLRFVLPQAGAPDALLVDMAYSIDASVTDNSSLGSPDAGYSAVTNANIGVYEVATITAAQQIYTPFAQGVTLQTFHTAPMSARESRDDMVETITVKPNTDYWVILSSTADLFLASLSLDPAPIDFAGLDVSLSATSDPVFSLNPAFANANPDVAAALEIARLSTVPIPAARPLLVTGLLGMVAFGRARALGAGH